MKQGAITLLLALWAWAGCLSEQAFGKVLFGGLGGYSKGTLTREEVETIGGATAQGYFGYAFSDYDIHAFFQHMELAYTFDNEHYKGIYTLSGVGLSYNTHIGRTGGIAVRIQKPLAGTYTVLSESKGKINDTEYLYSTLTTLKGGSALQALIGYELLSAGKIQSKSGEKGYFGFYIGYLQQSFAKQSIKIKTNNSQLAPASTGTKSVSYSTSLISLSVSINFVL